MRLVDMPFAIKITHSTVVRLKENLADVLPEWPCSLTPFSCLPVPTVQPDVIGTICAISNIESFDLPNRSGVLIKRHVHLRDLSGHEIKIVLWGKCALRFSGDTIRALGQTEAAVTIFVGTTAQEYDGERGLAGMAACSWYINEDIVDINIFRASLEGSFQPIAHPPLPHVLTRRTQLGVNWPTKCIAQMAAFNFFENKSRYRVFIPGDSGGSLVVGSATVWLDQPLQMHRHINKKHTEPHFNDTEEYCLPVIGIDQTREAEFILFGRLAKQATENSIQSVIRNNQPTGPWIVNDEVAASRVRFPPPEVSRILGNRYKFVVAVTESSFTKRETSFMVRKIEAIIPRVRSLSSLDTIIPATSWDIDRPMVEPGPSAQSSHTVEPSPSNQVNNIPAEPVVVIPTNTHINATPTNEYFTYKPNAVDYTRVKHNRAADRKTISNVETSPRFLTQTLLGICRGGVTADAIGWLKCGADGRWWNPGRVSALRSAHRRISEHKDLPCFGALGRDNTPTAACLDYKSVSHKYNGAP